MSFQNTSCHGSRASAVKEASSVKTQIIPEPIGSGGKHTVRSQCLVVSSDSRRRRMFQEAAINAGWHAMDYVDPDKAWTEAQRSMFQFALIDLHGSSEPSGYRALAERLAPQSDLLLTVCGDDEQPSQEIWARQLGTWLYLPGVSLDDDLTTVCGEARRVSSRLEDRNRTSRMAPRRVATRQRTKVMK